MKKLRFKASVMIFNILCPEAIFALAVRNRFRDHFDLSFMKSAQQKSLDDPSATDRMGGWAIEEESPWTRKVLAFRCSSNPESTKVKNEETKSYQGDTLKDAPLVREETKSKVWTFTHTVYVNMKGIRLVVGDPKQSGKVSVFEPEGYQRAEVPFEPAYSPLRLFSITKDEILDKSKEDWFAKSVTVAQILRLLVSICARKARGLSSSQLEILTLAFAVLAVVTYLFQWNKPRGIDIPTIVYLDRISDDLNRDRQIRSDLKGHRSGSESFEKHEHKLYIISLLSSTAAALIFGALHCLAWNFNFPSTAERIIWRVASIISNFLPATIGIIFRDSDVKGYLPEF